MIQILAVDMAYQKIKTKYYFHSENDWRFIKPGFIQFSLEIMENDPTVSQVGIKPFEGVQSENVTLLDTTFAGFSFNPALRRLQHYLLFEGGYANLTKNISYGKGAGTTQQLISMFYLQKGFHIIASSQTYIHHLGDERSSPKFKKLLNYKNKRLFQLSSQESRQCWYTNKINNFQHYRVRLMEKRREQLSSRISFQSMKAKNYELNLQNTFAQLGVKDYIQIGSSLDFLKIYQQQSFKQFKLDFQKTFPISTKVFKRDQIVEQFQTKNFTRFQHEHQIQQWINQFISKNSQMSKNINKSETTYQKLIKILAMFQNNQEALEAQYFFYNKIFNFSRFNEEESLCLFVQGQNLFTSSNYKQFLMSIQNQNYSNYKFVFVDQNSTDGSRDKFFNYIEKNMIKIKHRTFAIGKNNEKLGKAGNQHLRAKKYCKRDDIIVYLDGKGKLVGRQALNVINAVYQSNQRWFVLFNSLTKTKDNHIEQIKRPKVNLNSNLRIQNFPMNYFLRTVRYKLNTILPVEYITQYYLNNQTKYYVPQYYKTRSSDFSTYSFIQMSGPNKAKIQSYILFLYQIEQQKNGQCSKEFQQYTSIKSKLKTPLKQLNSFKEKPLPIIPYQISPSVLFMLKNSYNKFYICNSTLALEKKQNNQISNNYEAPESKMREFLFKAKQKIAFPNKYIKYKSFPFQQQLPFCLILDQQDDKQKKILSSLLSNQYQNTILVYRKQNQSYIDIQLSIFLQKYNKNVQLANRRQNIFNIIQKYCLFNSIILIVKDALVSNSLFQLNKYYQNYNIWITISENQEQLQILSYYRRVYDLLFIKDKNQSNKIYLEQNDKELICLGIIQMCANNSYFIERKKIYLQNKVSNFSGANKGILSFKNNQKIYKRFPYDIINDLSSDNTSGRYQRYTDMLKGKKKTYQPNEKTFISKLNMIKALQYQQILYLPQNHYLRKRQYIQYDQKYRISLQIQQQPFCVIVYTDNNTNQYRFEENLRSIFQQNYTNYRVVVIIDDSFDNIIKKILQKIAKQRMFPNQKIIIAQNKVKLNQTISIVNAGFNLCKEKQILVRVNGQDQLIGTQVFNIINHLYLQNIQLWAVYSNHKTNTYYFGTSQYLRDKYDYLDCQGKKKYLFMSGLMTWKVELLQRIPLEFYRHQFGGWLNILFDYIIQYPLVELSGTNRVYYLPEILLEKYENMNLNYSSLKKKQRLENNIKNYLITKKILNPLKKLDNVLQFRKQVADKLLQLSQSSNISNLRNQIL